MDEAVDVAFLWGVGDIWAATVRSGSFYRYVDIDRAQKESVAV